MTTAMDLSYRVAQFWQLLTAEPLPPESWQEIETLLKPSEVTLFRRFSTGDQQHSYRVMRTLRDAGHEEQHLLAAALLHDVGKTQYRLHVWERVLGSVVEMLCPRCAEVWGRGQAKGWRRPIVIRQQHADWGAELAEEAGSDPLTVTLIRHHQDKEGLLDPQMNRLLQALQWADNQN